MAEFDQDKNKLTLKLAYYGPTKSGKTTNLIALHDALEPAYKGEMMFLETKDDRTLFFDLLPMGFRAPSGLLIKFKLFTVPGQVIHDSTRKAVLSHSDGVIFVADSQINQSNNNAESFQNMEENINRVGLDFSSLPIVVQFNKRDLQNILSEEDIMLCWNQRPWPVVYACATQNKGIIETFSILVKSLYHSINTKYRLASEHDLDEQFFCRNIIGFSPDSGS